MSIIKENTQNSSETSKITTSYKSMLERGRENIAEFSVTL